MLLGSTDLHGEVLKLQICVCAHVFCGCLNVEVIAAQWVCWHAIQCFRDSSAVPAIGLGVQIMFRKLLIFVESVTKTLFLTRLQ